MKGKTMKKLVALGFILSCAIQLSGCGKSGSTENGQGQNDQADSDLIYVAQSQELDASALSFVKVIGDTMYYSTSEQLEETEGRLQKIYRLKFGETTPQKIPVELEPNVYVTDMETEEEGNFLFLLDKEGEDDNSFFLNRYKPDGTVLMSKDFTDLSKSEEGSRLQYMAEDGQGNIFLAGTENSPIWILDHEGSQTGKIDNDNWIDEMILLPNGNVAVYYRDGAGKAVLGEIDTVTKKLGKTYSKLPEIRNHFTAGRENTVLMLGSNKIYEYNVQTESYSEVLDLLKCGIDSNNIANMSMLEDGGILVAVLSWSGGAQKAELVCLTEAEDGEVPQKEKIVFGAVYFGEDIKQQVLLFNAQSDRYQVELKEYGDGDPAAGEMLLNAEIVAGNGPDLIDLQSISDMTKNAYFSKGVLEDLNPWIDADEEIKREDYIDKVLNAYQKDGKLYGIMPCFTLNTVIGKSSDVGNSPGWTIDDVMALVDAKPEGTELFRDCTKDQVLRYCCTMSIDCFVDLETGVCNFNDGYFEKVLEFVNRFPKEAMIKEEDDDIHTKIQNGEVLLEDVNIGDVAHYQMLCQLFEEPITFIGLPVKEGSGSYIMPNRLYAMNGKAKEKDGAWEFLRTFLLEDYQNEQTTFPILQSAFDAQMEEAMTPEYVEEGGPIIMNPDGTIREPKASEDGGPVERQKESYIWYGWETDVYSASKEDTEAIKSLLDMTDGVYNFYTEISNIIEEEAGPFFNGQKSAKDAADIIQSRVQIYVNENR